MQFEDTTTFARIEGLQKRISVIQGGTSAGKTIGVLMNIIDTSFEYSKATFSTCTDTFPNLRRGALKDFKAILAGTGRDRYFHEIKSIHTFENLCNGSVIEFFSTDEAGALGARREFLFINEANRVSLETFDQLETRTTERIWLDFNPVNEFWAHELIKQRDDVDFLKLNYLHNEALSEKIKRTIEMRRGDGTSNWWRVYGLGEIGSLEGNVYSGWIRVDEMPEGFVLKVVGVDFGFTNDPTAVIGIFENADGGICLKKYLYETGLLTSELCRKLVNNSEINQALFVCDNARPEIIAEMQAYGLRAIACDKTAGEKMNGKLYNIDLVKRRKVYYLSVDVEIEREYFTYGWRVQKSTGKTIDEPKDGNDHAMDAIAYGVRELSSRVVDNSIPTLGGSYMPEDEAMDGWDEDF